MRNRSYELIAVVKAGGKLGLGYRGMMGAD